MLEVTEVYLTQRPGADNSPSNGNFGVRKTQLQAPAPFSSMDNSSTNNNCVIVKSLYLSVDPALRQTLNLFCTSSTHNNNSGLKFSKMLQFWGIPNRIFSKKIVDFAI